MPGYMPPVMTMRTIVNAMAGQSCLRSMIARPLDEVQGNEEEIDDLDAHERHDETAESVDQQVPAENHGRRRGAILDAAQRERNERDDDERVENHAREDRGLRRVQAHDVERLQRRKRD